MTKNEKIILLTADIGFGVLDDLFIKFGSDRVMNVGSCETLLIGIAVGYAYEGFVPICYTITPFLIFRPFEIIRNYVDFEKLNIKLVGCGRDNDYANHGISHNAEDDTIIIQSAFKNIHIFKPEELTFDIFRSFMDDDNPVYINLKRD
jgi:transketolase